MNTAPRFYTDFFDQERDLKYSKQLTLLVAITQLVGLALIWIALAILDLPPYQRNIRFWMILLGFFSWVAWLIYCWFDQVNIFLEYVDFIEWNAQPLHEAQRKTRVLRGILLLIVIDTFMLATLITVTGGPGSSPLDPLLPVIPIIAMILQQPKRTVYLALLSGLSVIFVFLGHWLIHHAGLPHPDFLSGRIYDAHADKSYPIAFGIVAIGAVGLTVFEFLISHKRPRLRKGITTTLAPLLVDVRTSISEEISNSIRRGTAAWIKWLEHRDLPTADLSLVHEEQEMIKQAAVLCIPYWSDNLKWWTWQRRRITRRITFLTLASHWIDDHFDSLRVYCENQDLIEQTLHTSPQRILSTNYYRLDELLRGMKRIAHKDHKGQVEKAIVRIIYGGLIQNAENEARLMALVEEYISFVSADAHPAIRAIYAKILQSERPLTASITAKVVMELLDCCSPLFNPTESEFFNLLYGPLLYYQDYNNEISLETFGHAFGESPEEIIQRLPRTGDILTLLDDCYAIVSPIFDSNTLPLTRKQQLKMLLHLYGEELPTEVKNSYGRFI